MFQISTDELDNVLALYPLDAYDDPYWALTAIWSDWNLKCSSRRFARLYSGAMRTTYLYQYAYIPPDNGFYNTNASLGSYHGAEIPYIWHSDYVFPSDATSLADAMITYWSTFASNHTPSYTDGVAWPWYDSATDMNILLNATISTQTGMGVITECAYWDQFAYTPQPSCYLM